MDQIKLLPLPNQEETQFEKTYEFQEIVNDQIRKSRPQAEELEPWLEETERNPFISYKSERVKKAPNPRLKKIGSFSITRNWKSQEKIISHRQSKILPIMDVGEINKIRKSLNPAKTISKLDLQSPLKLVSKSRSSNSELAMLPSVTRQLNIERKIFLMKQVYSQQSQTSSPQKGHRIRTIIHELRR